MNRFSHKFARFTAVCLTMLMLAAATGCGGSQNKASDSAENSTQYTAMNDSTDSSENKTNQSTTAAQVSGGVFSTTAPKTEKPIIGDTTAKTTNAVTTKKQDSTVITDATAAPTTINPDLQTSTPLQEKAAESKYASIGYDLVWRDEFNGSAIDRSIWKNEIGFVRNGEPQYYTDRPLNMYVNGGALVLNYRTEDYNGAKYTSASVTSTSGSGGFCYYHGILEVRVRMPKGAGMWTAIWMMGVADDTLRSIGKGYWPYVGEIDIVEMWGDNNYGNGLAIGNAHCGDPWEGTKHDSGSAPRAYSLGLGNTFNDQYHTFRFDWTDDEMKWYCDDFNFYTEKITDKNDMYCFRNLYMYVLLNFAIDKNLIDENSPKTEKYYIDYVRLYQDKNDSTMDFKKVH